MRKRILYISSIIILSLFLGFSAATSAEAVEDFSGYWSGTWRCTTHNRSGFLGINLIQIGTNINGTMTLTGKGNCVMQNWPLTGNITKNVLNCEAIGKCSNNPEDSGSIQLLLFLANNNLSGYYTYHFNGAFYCRGDVDLTRSINFINATAGAGGTIVPTGKISVKAGSDKTFKIAPNDGYKILDVKVDGVSVGAKNSYTFNNISANHTIVASFETAPAAKSSAVPTSVAPLLLNGGQD